jgi:hypothetical protein
MLIFRAEYSRMRVPRSVTCLLSSSDVPITLERACTREEIIMAIAKPHHVVRSPKGGWIVRREGSERASRRFDNLMDAFAWGRALADRQGTELVVHWPPLVRRGPVLHVATTVNGVWSVRKTGAGRALKKFATRQEALEWGRMLSRKHGLDLVVHRSNGSVEQLLPA